MAELKILNRHTDRSAQEQMSKEDTDALKNLE
jgi:hypothetical protein